MIRINREKFFDSYREHFGRIPQPVVDALDDLLDAIEADNSIQFGPINRRRLAYALATFKWETAHTFRPIHEIGGNAYFERNYGYQTKVGKRLGNDEKGEGAKYHGRGFVQLTGESNYEKATRKLGIDFVNFPDLALHPDNAYRIAMLGMKEGWFTGLKFADFINETETDFEDARRIINGKDKAAQIAQIARAFDDILKDSIERDAAEQIKKKPEPDSETPAPSANTSENSKNEAHQNDQVPQPGKMVEGQANQNTPPDKVCIEKPEPQNFLQKMWKKVSGFFVGQSIADIGTEKLAQVNALGLSADFWKRLFYVALAAGLVYLIAEFYRHWQWKRDQAKITELLVQANTTPTNKVTLAASEDLDRLKEAGYSIVRRGE